MKIIINETDYAYIAGYIDGDGCFYIGYDRSAKRLKPKPITSITISSVNNEVLYHFKSLYGGSVNTSKGAYDNCKSQYHFTLRKTETCKLVNNILPYLVEKQDQCILLQEFAQLNEFNAQVDCINKMKILKHDTNLAQREHKIEFEPYKNTIKPSTIDYAYLAGFIDAECCFGISKYKPKDKPNYVYKILLQCNNTKAPVFKWLIERFGGHINFVDRQKYNVNNQLCWRISGHALHNIINNIYQFLRYKKAVCKQLIDFYATTLPNGGARHTEIFRTQYAEVIKERERIINIVHKLNLKGINSF